MLRIPKQTWWARINQWSKLRTLTHIITTEDPWNRRRMPRNDFWTTFSGLGNLNNTITINIITGTFLDIIGHLLSLVRQHPSWPSKRSTMSITIPEWLDCLDSSLSIPSGYQCLSHTKRSRMPKVCMRGVRTWWCKHLTSLTSRTNLEISAAGTHSSLKVSLLYNLNFYLNTVKRMML